MCRVHGKFWAIFKKKIVGNEIFPILSVWLSSTLWLYREGGGLLRSIELKFVMIVIASFRNVLRGGGGGGGDGRADSRVIIFTWSRSGHALVMLWSCSLLSHFIELCDRLLHCIIARTSTRRNFIFYRWLWKLWCLTCCSLPPWLRCRRWGWWGGPPGAGPGPGCRDSWCGLSLSDHRTRII